MIDSTLLMVLNPRELLGPLLSLERLDCPKVWLRYYSEWELRKVIADVVASTNFKSYAVISDDCVVSWDAYEAVLKLHDLDRKHVVTGYCNLDVSSNLVNLTRTPFKDSRPPDEGSYDWFSLSEVEAYDEYMPIASGFAGMSFTCMSRDMWIRFPWDCYGQPKGWAADYHLALRLRDAGVRIFAPKYGFVFHTKKNWLDHSTNERTKIYVGERPAEVRWEL